MCTRKKLLGCVLTAFGTGILVGLWLEGGFFCTCIGAVLVILGLGVIRRM